MSFDIDPADERTQLDECIHEIKTLQARIAVLEKVREVAKQLNSRLRPWYLKEQRHEPWLGIFSDRLEEALKQAVDVG